jgi:hypothetical protein
MAVGVVCEHDLADKPGAIPVSRCVRSPTPAIPLASSGNTAATLMQEWRVGCLPVTYRGFVVGVITAEDLARGGVVVDREGMRP